MKKGKRGKCKNCAYHYTGEEDEKLVSSCLRFPPSYTESYGWQFARIESDDWCGEHKPRGGTK